MRRCRPLLAIALVALSACASGCGALRSSGGASRSTRTAPPTATATVAPAPPATPTPSLPPNPRGLHRWTSLPVHYCIDETHEGWVGISKFVTLVDRAFSAWGVPAVDDGACSGPNAGGDKVNEIGFGTPLNQPPPGSHVAEAGETSTIFSECTSGCDRADPVRLVEADVVIEALPPRQFRTRACLYSTLLHETGHVLGLGHLAAPAVMAAETSDCSLELTPADHAALLARYGDRATPQ